MRFPLRDVSRIGKEQVDMYAEGNLSIMNGNRPICRPIRPIPEEPMNFATEYLLLAARKYYGKIRKIEDADIRLPQGTEYFESSGQDASDFIKGKLLASGPFMAARLGAVELNCLLTYHSIRQDAPGWDKCIRFIRHEIHPFWWSKKVRKSMANNAGFFPVSESALSRFCDRMLSDLRQLDVLGSWLRGESVFREYFPNALKIPLWDLEPYHHLAPWSEALKDRAVLVIHPFEETIRKQYGKRVHLHRDARVLPAFELKTLKAVQSIAGNEVPFSNWFEALDFMSERVENTRFDVALIGCGAYGFPLAAFVKRLGKQAIHLGGALQLLFGIRGKRWDQLNRYNEHWVRPAPEETPATFSNVEEGCYW